MSEIPAIPMEDKVGIIDIAMIRRKAETRADRFERS